jgi:hypothetical protein
MVIDVSDTANYTYTAGGGSNVPSTTIASGVSVDVSGSTDARKGTTALSKNDIMDASHYYVTDFSLTTDNKLTLKLADTVTEIPSSDTYYYPLLKTADKVKIALFGGGKSMNGLDEPTNFFTASPSDATFVVFEGINTYDDSQVGTIARASGSTGNSTDIYYVWASKDASFTPPTYRVTYGNYTLSCITSTGEPPSLKAGWNEVKVVTTTNVQTATMPSTLSVITPMDNTDPGWTWTDNSSD